MNANSNFQPSEDLFDDVEAHGISSGRIEAQDDDVEAHALRSGRIMAPDHDVKGSGV